MSRRSWTIRGVDETKQPIDTKAYWAANLRLTVALLCIWFAVSYGAGILFREQLDQFSIGGAPLGFWHALHDHIRVAGGGRFSHWGDQLLFSTTDNSDPNLNVLTYAYGMAY